MNRSASSDAPIGVRRVEPADLAAVRDIEAEYGNLRTWPDRPHFLDHEFEAGRMVLAELGNEVVGFAGVFDYGELTYLADLFVRSSLVGRGIGKGLLEAILPTEDACATLASSDPRALPCHARMGMRPVVPMLYLSGGRDAAAKLTAQPRGLREASAAAELDELVGLGCHAVRPPATCRASLPAGPLRDDAPQAFIGPRGATSEAGLAGLTEAAIHHAARFGHRIHLSVLGPHSMLPALLRAGFRIDGMDILMSTALDLMDGRRYAPGPEFG
jgi:GNAT superfamily N-acetyltransferase